MLFEKEIIMPRFVENKNTRINQAIQFATIVHGSQVRKGNEHVPYIFHCIDTANEVIDYSGLPVHLIEIAAVTAILHDTVEDTAVTIECIQDQFGVDVMRGVEALSKNTALSNAEGNSKGKSLHENLERIKVRAIWVQTIKLADRISNLKTFPAMWSREKINAYLNESKIIADILGDSSEGLTARLLSRIVEIRKMLSLVP